MLSAGISGSQALAIAQDDAVRAYRDMNRFRVHVVLESDGWHVDYELRELHLYGGGPHYVIDSGSGAILLKRYEQ